MANVRLAPQVYTGYPRELYACACPCATTMPSRPQTYTPRAVRRAPVGRDYARLSRYRARWSARWKGHDPCLLGLARSPRRPAALDAARCRDAPCGARSARSSADRYYCTGTHHAARTRSRRAVRHHTQSFVIYFILESRLRDRVPDSTRRTRCTVHGTSPRPGSGRGATAQRCRAERGRWREN